MRPARDAPPPALLGELLELLGDAAPCCPGCFCAYTSGEIAISEMASVETEREVKVRVIRLSSFALKVEFSIAQKLIWCATRSALGWEHRKGFKPLPAQTRGA